MTFLNRTPQGRLLELPLSWYTRSGGWGMSPGYDRADHDDFRREISDSCLFCHSAGPDPAPIDCGRCHGDVQKHLKSPMKGSILNPAKLSSAATTRGVLAVSSADRVARHSGQHAPAGPRYVVVSAGNAARRVQDVLRPGGRRAERPPRDQSCGVSSASVCLLPQV